MKKYHVGKDTWDMSEEQLHLCRSLMPEELVEMAQLKVNIILSSIGPLTFEQRCCYKELMMMGYLAANCTSDEENNLEIKLSPLGKALE